ncbi:MAG: hypothetical protein QG573_2211, partial [Acidobacteriota bacterium]|nr:hypothetical protein [Acidobacteriota bacterium]
MTRRPHPPLAFAVLLFGTLAQTLLAAAPPA